MAVHMYTDDPIFVVVGVQRAKRLLSVWRSVTAKISADSELYAIVRASTEALGLMTLFKDVGMTVVDSGCTLMHRRPRASWSARA